MRKSLVALLTVSLAVAVLGVVQGWSYDQVAVTDGAVIAGEVKLNGNIPKPKALEVTKDQEVCGTAPKVSEELIVSQNKGIKNAVVFLTDIKQGKKIEMSSKPQFEQKGCSFNPHVLIFPAGSAIDILNNDGILHNLHTYSTANPAVNKAQPKTRKVMSEKIEKPEFIKVNCDAHSWMQGWLVAAEHPYYALTDENGAFKLTDVPAGTYTLKIWHEVLGEQTKQITVSAKGEAKASFELSQK
ncbi:MAG: hypothetical protein HY731_11090 [Candidatus Tectomicrobia bacterium]|nr:hypothetical protein [Candidatus Tectomicrobia bacterium]